MLGSSVGWIASVEISYGMGILNERRSIWSSGNELFVERNWVVWESRKLKSSQQSHQDEVVMEILITTEPTLGKCD